jgi:nucleoid-associated protein YgaU
VIAPGDTVWDLARRHAPAGAGVGEYAAVIVRANGVDARRLQPGDVLVLP